MTTTDPRIDAYIERAAPFARSILAQLLSAMHAADPGLTETIKWSMPFFELERPILANMAAFKQYRAFRFWRGRNAADQGKPATGSTRPAYAGSGHTGPVPVALLHHAVVAQLQQVRCEGAHRHRVEPRWHVGVDLRQQRIVARRGQRLHGSQHLRLARQPMTDDPFDRMAWLRHQETVPRREPVEVECGQ